MFHHNLDNYSRTISRLHSAGRITIQNNYALGFLGPQNKLRRFCGIVCQHWGFELFITLFIIASSCTLTFETPLTNPQSEVFRHLEIFDIVTTVVFTLEGIMKIITFGFIWNGKYSYLKSNWNVMDFFILITSIIDLILSISKLRALTTVRLLRLVRILRPMRIVVKN